MRGVTLFTLLAPPVLPPIPIAAAQPQEPVQIDKLKPVAQSSDRQDLAQERSFAGYDRRRRKTKEEKTGENFDVLV